jgi:hypothetical protein
MAAPLDENSVLNLAGTTSDAMNKAFHEYSRHGSAFRCMLTSGLNNIQKFV